jgi:hypothetical protein
MPDPKRTPAGRQEEQAREQAREERSTRGGGSEGRAAADVGLEFARSIERLSQEAQNTSARLYNDYLGNVSAVWTDLQQRNIEAHRTLIEELKSAFGATETVEKCGEAYQQYVELMRALWDPSDVRTRTEDAYRTFIAAASEVHGHVDAQRRYDEAYRAYIEAIRGAWDRSELYGKAEQAFASYLSLLREAQQEGERRASEAYRKYVDRIRENAAQGDLAGRLRAAAETYGKGLQAVMSDAQAKHRDAAVAALRSVEQAWQAASPTR